MDADLPTKIQQFVSQFCMYIHTYVASHASILQCVPGHCCHLPHDFHKHTSAHAHGPQGCVRKFLQGGPGLDFTKQGEHAYQEVSLPPLNAPQARI